MTSPFQIAGEAIPPGARHRLELPIARLPTETWVSMPLEVVHGRRPGPRLWLSAAVHGDELNGVEIIRQVLETLDPVTLVGTIVAAPIINVFGFLNQSRYLPDRRDLNRCFPGNSKGSLASRLANLFMTEVVQRCTHGIDLHTGSNHRTNWPQIRANLADPETLRCANAFRAPIMISSDLRDGSLREAASEYGVPVLLYEGGEPQRFNREAISRGVEGVLRVMSVLGMCKRPKFKKREESLVARTTTWVRARRGGIFRLEVELGDRVKKKQQLGFIGNALAGEVSAVSAPVAGVVIGLSNNPLVNQGDSLVHIAEL
ncbi:succinylglutamate desuccinylase/aspartoacylase family protein [Lignipirellula cremea]|uniref:Succinylglutamate desuccinylase / Aspartoacylase family protein n=1 Tax=Lignipirellula cremea TaxID=2528010 RepID=A0A518DN23_9BACT|nr:succinylglutamate desuccinylase/aspartoacylase family protein [Lignipirellula cremea]QDU93238.1 Succinylglutamate desuccinylase / Aspartoacylase family protein [Lignipirellula cremea]